MRHLLALLSVFLALPLGAQTRTCTKLATGIWRCQLPPDTVRRVDTVRITTVRTDTVWRHDTIFVTPAPIPVPVPTPVPVPVPEPTPVPSPVNPGYPNEPAGSTALLDWDTDFANLPAAFYYKENPGNLSTTTDPTAPVNPNRVGRVRFSPGCCDGSGPAQLSMGLRLPATWTTLYVSDWLKFDATFRPHGCCQKIWHILGTAGGDNYLRFMTNLGVPLTPQFNFSGPGVPGGTVNLGSTKFITLGVWYHVEAVLTRAGRMTLWVREQGKSPVLMYDGTPTGGIGPTEVVWWWGYGGSGAYPGPTSYIYHNHFRVSWR